MGLKIQPTRRIGSKITTLIAVFALVMQPMYGLVAERVANAAVGDPVCISGGDCYSTIQSAINAASSDATITVASGTYNESVVINKSITLRGAQSGIDASTRTINGAGESVVNSGTQTAFTISANNVKLDGFQVMQSGSGSHTITTPANYSGITLENNIVTNTTLTGSAMHLYGGQNFTIRQNYFSGIYTGIVLRNGNLATPVATNQKIIDNKFDNVRAMTGGTIVVYGQTDLEIARNDIKATFQGIAIGATGGAHYMMHGVNVHNNTINLTLPSNGDQPNVHRFGVFVEGMSEGVVIKNNTIKQTGVTPDSTTRYGLIRVSYDDVATTSANPTGLVITENDIESAAGDRAVLVGKNVTNQIDASENWWGSQANPANKITSSSATVVSSPWLCQSFTSGSTTSVSGSCVPVDSTPPTFNITNLSNGQMVGTANTNKLVIKGTLTDPSGAYALIQLVKPGVGVVADNVTVHAPVENDILAEFNTAGLASGAYELHIRPTDYKGNAIPFYVINFNLDTVSPTFAITSPANNSTVSRTITINAEVKDANDITKLLMNVGGKSLSWTPASNGTNITRSSDIFSAVIDTKTLPDGPVYVTLRGTDGAGNTRYWNNNSANRQHVFIVDNTAPTINYKSPKVGSVVSKNVSFEFEASDATSGIRNVNLHLMQNNTTKQIVSLQRDGQTNRWYSVGTPLTVDDGVYYIVSRATDNAGNTQFVNSNHGAITVDGKDPTISINSFQGDKALRIFREVSFGYYDANKVAYAEFNGTTTHDFGDAVWSNTNTVWANRGWTGVDEGPNTVDLYDLAGNKSSLDFTIDRTAPDNVNIAIDNDVNPSEAIISAKDAHLNRIDVSLWKEGEDGYVAFPGEWINPIGTDFSKDYADKLDLAGLADGNYEIRATAGDAAENSKNAESVFFTIDRTAPVITITTATPSEVRGTVDADATEIWVKVGSGPEQRATYTPGETTWTLAISPALTAGADVIARAVDAANNTNSASTNPRWATRTISVTPGTSTRVTNNPLVSRNGTPSQGGSSAILANSTPALQVTSPVADTTDETGDVAGAATVNKDSEDKGQVLAAEDAKDSWSLINLLLTIGIGVASIISLLGLIGSSRKDRKLASRLLTIVPAAGAVVALLLIEDFSGSMIWVNTWSLLIGALAVVQMIILGMNKATTNE